MKDWKPFGSVMAVATLLLAGDFAVRHVGAQNSANTPKVVTAQEFRLVDKAGKTRALMALKDDGSPSVTLMDKDGNIRASLRVRPDGSSAFSLHDKDGNSRAALDTQSSGNAGLLLTNKDGKGGAAVVINPNGHPAAIFKNPDGKVIWSAPEPEIEIKPDP